MSSTTFWILSRSTGLPQDIDHSRFECERFEVLAVDNQFPDLVLKVSGLFQGIPKFSKDKIQDEFLKKYPFWYLRKFHPQVVPPKIQSLGSVLGSWTLTELNKAVYVFEWLACKEKPDQEMAEVITHLWREPALEVVQEFVPMKDLGSIVLKRNSQRAADPSFDIVDPISVGLEFSRDELKVVSQYEKDRKNKLTRAEWEVLAQSWSEHCKHKIFSAEITLSENGEKISGLFFEFIRKPSLKIIEKRNTQKKTYLSVFEDNAGIVNVFDDRGDPTDFAFCIKMETHNSPSALSPKAGAATGLVGVHRDILGTGLGARPLANWNVLGFETPFEFQSRSDGIARPQTALAPDIIRRGVLAGIEEGGNQSGVPTVSGSVSFDPRFSVKPYVFVGALGLLKSNEDQKKPRPGQRIFVFGGETGADGLRGAVMSSRDLRQEDFSGSAVQMAQAFVQRRMTDFLLEAKEKGLVQVITDNGAGGLSSSVGEMAQLTGGARIELTHLRLKFEGLYAWEKLLSESQERMTVATDDPDQLRKLARFWKIEFDEIGELTNTGFFEVIDSEKVLVRFDLDFLHRKCPKLRLQTNWTREQESLALKGDQKTSIHQNQDLYLRFQHFLERPEVCSREEIVRRFDHEVGGRTLVKPFSGEFQTSPSDGNILEVFEVEQTRPQLKAAVALGHGWAPQRTSIFESTLWAFDETLRQLVLSGGDLSTAGILDNYSWPDPTDSRYPRRLWRLVQSVKMLKTLSEFYEIPFVSGKDSLKNNSKDFAAPEAIVVSGACSVRNLVSVPSSNFSKANDVLLFLKGPAFSWADTDWARLGFSGLRGSENNLDFEKFSSGKHLEESLVNVRKNYTSLSGLIQSGRIKAIKDLSQGGVGVALFEMCLGFKKGIFFESEAYFNEEKLFLERWGSFVLCVDPHHVSFVLNEMPQLERLGVVIAPFVWNFGQSSKSWDLEPLKVSYLKLGKSGFWGVRHA